MCVCVCCYVNFVCFCVCDMQHANRGNNPWKDWAKEVDKAQSCSTTKHTPAGGANAWRQYWDSTSSRKGSSSQWSVPTNKNSTGSDYDTDREWRRSKMRYNSGWANDPTWSQSKRVTPTHIDPEDDQRTDPTLPSGSTSKTWDPCAHDNFWTEKSSSEDPAKGLVSAISMQWRPKLRAD